MAGLAWRPDPARWHHCRVVDDIEDARWTGATRGGHRGLQPQMAQDAPDDTRLLDERDETQPPPRSAGTGEQGGGHETGILYRIAMDDPALVRCFQCVRDLLRDPSASLNANARGCGLREDSDFKPDPVEA